MIDSSFDGTQQYPSKENAKYNIPRNAIIRCRVGRLF